MADLEPKRTYYLEIGFIISLALIIFPLEIITYFSKQPLYSVPTLKMEMPVVLGLNKELLQTSLQKRSKRPEVLSPPKISSQDYKAENVLVNEDIAKKEETLDDSKIDIDEDLLSDVGSGLKEEDKIKDLTPLMVIDETPSFPGGAEALKKFMEGNIKYPPLAKESGIIGIVHISFLVEKDGSITQIKITQGIINGGGCNEEALRVVNKMPKWKPGKKHGKPIRAQINLPVIFFLSPS